MRRFSSSARPTTALAAVPGGVATIAFSAAENNIQNGAPDAVGLLDTATGQLLDSLSYEGSVTAANVSGVSGTLNFVEGTAATAEDVNDAVGSVCRLPNGIDSDDADADWAFTSTPTPGAPNVP